MIVINPTLAIDEREIDERFVRSSGPGGQNVNKVSTAVELRFDVARSSLPAEIQTRLRDLAGSRVTSDGVLVIDAREHRTQTKNREAARARFVELVRRAAVKPRVRRKTKPSRSAREERLVKKIQAAGRKQSRRAVRHDDD